MLKYLKKLISKSNHTRDEIDMYVDYIEIYNIDLKFKPYIELVEQSDFNSMDSVYNYLKNNEQLILDLNSLIETRAPYNIRKVHTRILNGYNSIL